MKKIILFVILLSLKNLLLGQKNLIYGEIGGNAIYYSLNYEREISKLDEIQTLYLRVGASIVGEKTANFTYTGVNKSTNLPIMINWTKGKKHRIEVGGGTLLSFQEGIEKKFHLYPTASVRYRFEPENKGIIFKAGWTPILIDTEGIGLLFLLVPGISLGYKF